MASSGTTATGSVVTLGEADDEIVSNDDDSTGVGMICPGGASVDILTTSIYGREDISCSATISLVDAATGSWLEEVIPNNGTEEGGSTGGVDVKDLGQGGTGAVDVEA